MENKVAQIRQQLPALDKAVYLNTGTAGPLPGAVVEAMTASLEAQRGSGRIGGDYFARLQEMRGALRARLAALLNCASGEVALTASTTEGMSLITMGINWQPGDEAITTNVEHPAALLPLYTAQQRFGIGVRIADLRRRPEAAAEVIERMITPRTRLISLSHVSYLTGAVLPVREIAAAAHRRGVPVLVDGAQSFAAIPLDMKELGCDFYAVPGQKWICGPEGTGALYVSQDALSHVMATMTGYYSVEKYSAYGGMLLKGNAQRFEQGTFQPAVLAGHLEACRWFAEEVGPEWAFSRIRSLARLARESLAATPGVTVITPVDAAGLVSFTVEGRTPEQVLEGLAGEAITGRTVAEPHAVRIATGFYNTEDEIARTVAAVARVGAART